MSPSFEDFNLSPELLQAVKDMGFEEPSPIQVLAVPFLLTGRDAVGQAQTGTGKTAAFGMPILEKLTSARDMLEHGQRLSSRDMRGRVPIRTAGEHLKRPERTALRDQLRARPDRLLAVPICR